MVAPSRFPPSTLSEAGLKSEDQLERHGCAERFLKSRYLCGVAAVDEEYRCMSLAGVDAQITLPSAVPGSKVVFIVACLDLILDLKALDEWSADDRELLDRGLTNGGNAGHRAAEAEARSGSRASGWPANMARAECQR
ncbi:hypothetical protein BKA70DRAFT_1424007 [Coprinopsis sp. MPI-PUGE-AT-0042]|nr:hypothetical protein BKA70DRAFT_1424007 [Coprinopsis sp. MPI-PUGE-AT-0042]